MSDQRIELINPFELGDEYQWLRGNFHSHTTNSDGHKTPQDRIDGYVKEGYDFLAVSDHDRITRPDGIETPMEFVLVPGVELHPDNPFGGERHHFLAMGVSEDLDARRMPPQHVIDAVREQGGSIWLAHPYWSNINILRDTAPLTGLAGVEVFNSTGELVARGTSSVHWDDWMLISGGVLPAIANDDCHSKPDRPGDEYGGWTMVRTRERTPEAIVAAVAAGASYATTGPTLSSITVEATSSGSTGLESGARARLRFSTAIKVYAIADRIGIRVPTEVGSGAEMDSAEIEIPAGKRWVRFEVHDAQGGIAWSNPFDLTR